MKKELPEIWWKVLGVVFVLFLVVAGCVYWQRLLLSGSEPRIEDVFPTEEEVIGVEAEVFLTLMPEEPLAVGEKTWVTVQVKADKRIVGADVFLVYDPEEAELGEMEKGSFFDQVAFFQKELSSPGQALVSINSLEGGEGEGNLIRFELTPKVALPKIAFGEETVVSLTEAGKPAIISTEGINE